MAIYNAGNSDGQPLEIIGTKTVVITNEALNKASAQVGESVTYSVTIKDDLGAGLPATFVVDLELNGTKIIEGQVLNVGVYAPVIGVLTLPFIAPANPGSHTVRLAWAEQTI